MFVSDSGGTGNLLLEDCVGGMGRSGTNEAGDDPEADKKVQRKQRNWGKESLAVWNWEDNKAEAFSIILSQQGSESSQRPEVTSGDSL